MRRTLCQRTRGDDSCFAAVIEDAKAAAAQAAVMKPESAR